MEVDEMIDNVKESAVSKVEEKPDTVKHSVEDYRRLYKVLLSKYTAKLDRLKELAATEKSIRNVVKYQTARNNALVDILDYVDDKSEPVIDENAKLRAIIANRPELAQKANAILEIDSWAELPELPQDLKDRLYISELVDPLNNLNPASEEVQLDMSSNCIRRANNELVEADNVFLSFVPKEVLESVDRKEPQDAFPFTSTKILRQSNPEMFHLDHEDPDTVGSSLAAWKKAAGLDANPKKKKHEDETAESSKRPKIIKFPVS